MLWQVLFLALVLAVNNFFGAASLGARDLDLRARLRIVGLFAAADCGLPLVGVLLGSVVAHWLGGAASWAGAIIIMLTAIYMFFDAPAPAQHDHRGSLLRLVPTAVALSLDNLGAGVGLGAMGFNLGISLVAFASVTAVMTALGLLVGRFLYGLLAPRQAAGVSGALLFLTGAGMLASRLHVY